MAIEFRVGDVVEIIGNCNSHCFGVGGLVKLASADACGGFVGNGNAMRGNLSLKDIKPANANSIRYKTKRTALQCSAKEVTT